MKKMLSTKERMYFANASIAFAQVFSGIMAVAAFSEGKFDLGKIIVISCNTTFTVIFIGFGWKLVK